MTTQKQREQNRERQQRFRDRQKLSREEADYANKINTEELALRVKAGKCFLGEISPGEDAATIADALQVAREMARALNIVDVEAGESLIQFERRVWDGWIRRDAPFLNRDKQTLVKGWGGDYFVEHCGGFDKCWSPLPGSDAAIASLPELPPIPEIV
jgi:hypothetical protein